MTTLYVDNIAPNLQSRVSVPGHVIQVVESISTTRDETTSTSYVTSSVSGSITPTSSTSKILVLTSLLYEKRDDSNSLYSTIFRDSTNIGSGSQDGLARFRTIGSTVANSQLTTHLLDSPSTTSEITYTVYFKSQVSGQTVKFVNDTIPGRITLMEIAG